ncbi:uncharacterized protein LOC114738662 [Neltuma alba]|uniref:uncharacterized protein LOC114738662 n=1 Tax=Neltuma alba TaxID=207710 RepID=UPI0010A36D57|nr:uncharacterized protein LOC114738662 [Prosopis alba]
MAKMMPFHGRTEKDDDLILFKDLQKQKRENERNSSLLRPVSSDDYECDSNGDCNYRKYPLYRIPSGKKESSYEFLTENHKNDYDWLKTPPATPLFPSLEMEPGAPTDPQLVQKELPIIQPLSRFAGSDLEASKPETSEGRANHMNSSKPKLSTRSTIPSHNRQRPSIVKNNTNEQESSILSTKNNSNSKLHMAITASNVKTTNQKQSSDADTIALNLKKSHEVNDPKRMLKSRGISPFVRSSVAAHITKEFPDKAPPNLRTDHRSTSATRGRISNPTLATVGFQNHDTTPRASRQSRSPSRSVSHGKKQSEGTQKEWRNHKERSVSGSGESRTHVRGSKMVEKVVNARRSANNQAERETKPKPLKYRA